MHVLIKSHGEAREYDPKRPTYVIGVFSSNASKLERMIDLFLSDYLDVKEYVFDNSDPNPPENPVLLDEELARKIVADFAPYRSRAEVLLVHDKTGKTKSPAVAAALNRAFNLEGAEDIERSIDQLIIDYDGGSEEGMDMDVYNMVVRIANQQRL